MSKLFTIAVRWLRRDKKRTLLSFLSVLMAMYMMTFLGIYFSSAISMIESKTAYTNGNNHIRFACTDLEQAEKITKAKSVSESAYMANSFPVFANKYLNDYRDKIKSGECYLPRVLINGKDIYSVNDRVYSASVIKNAKDSSYLELSGMADSEIEGRNPEKPDEIMLDASTAEQFGLSVGSKFTVSYEVAKGSVEYCTGEADESSFKPDDAGIFSKLDVWDQQANFLPKVMNSLIYDSYTFNAAQEGSDENTACTVRAKLSDEIVETDEKTYTVVGTVTSYGYGDFNFSADDEWARQFVETNDCEISCYVRIKDGYDISDEAKNLSEAAGISDINKDDDGYVKENIVINGDLIFFEGRDLSFMSNLVVIFVVMVVVIAVFVFYARLIVNNAFELSNAYRMEQYGTLKTIGASNRQVFAIVMIECLIYLVISLPIAIGLAVLTGKIIMSKIMDIKIFDVLYGKGVTEQFFNLKIIPLILVIVTLIAVFSVLMSSYACALRIKNLTPIEAIRGKQKNAKLRSGGWFTRKHFGFAAGYAVRSARSRKMQGWLVLLATVVSGTLVVAITSLIIGVENSNLIQHEEKSDYEVLFWEGPYSDGKVAEEELPKLQDNELFTSAKIEKHGDSKNIMLMVNEGKEKEAVDYLNDNYSFYIDNTIENTTNQRTAEALRLAGLSLAVVIFAVAMINIISTSAAVIVNRRRELSMLRSCGMTLRQVCTSLIIEALGYAFLTALLSALFGRLIASPASSLISDAEPVMPWLAVICIFFLVFVLMFGAYLPTLRAMTKTPISEEIRMKE